MIDWLERSVKRQRPTKVRDKIGQPTKKRLGVRYAEVLRLRQMIEQAQSEKPMRYSEKKRETDRPLQSKL
jgi:hypothetical protein